MYFVFLRELSSLSAYIIQSFFPTSLFKWFVILLNTMNERTNEPQKLQNEN